jgi:hypothetical protein
MIALAVRHWKTGLVLICAAGWLWTVADLHKERGDHMATKARHAYEKAASTAAALSATQQIRTLESEIAHAQESHAKIQADLANERRARAAAVRATDDRLRNAAATLARNSGDQCPTTGPAGNQPTAAEALDLLAKLLARVAVRTGQLAEFADASHAAATACAADYDRARDAVNSAL